MTPSDSRPPRPTSPRPEALEGLIQRATLADGSPPFSDGALVELANGTRELLWVGDAAALVTPTEAEFVVDPDARRHGHGTRMLEALTTDHAMLFWAHGDHPAARALAASHGLVAARTLLHLEAPVPPLLPLLRSFGAETGISAPEPATWHETSGETERWWSSYAPAYADAWLVLNARAFAHHAEQGAVTQADLDVITAEPWFDPDDFLLLWDSEALIGYCWLKLDGGEGEFYVVGVSPDRQGQGLGKRLMEAGFARLASSGIRTAHLYVEGDNVSALALYTSFGFRERSIDVQYCWTSRA